MPDTGASPREHPTHCPVTYFMSFLGGKWKPIILHRIHRGVNRFSLLHNDIPGISKQMLTSQLREMVEDGILERTAYREVPPRVEYSVTELGQTMLPVIVAMSVWGRVRIAESR